MCKLQFKKLNFSVIPNRREKRRNFVKKSFKIIQLVPEHRFVSLVEHLVFKIHCTDSKMHAEQEKKV
jgi:hypothetical protein